MPSRAKKNYEDDDDEVDALAAINAELREMDDDDDPESPWLPLESNPEVFTEFAHKSGGLPKDWGWIDILGLDHELLNMVPAPCAGVILLFPCSDNIYEERRLQKQQLLAQEPTPATKAAYHVKQVAEFGNACGTIASVHALINGANVYKAANSALSQFRDGNANASPQDRGRALLQTSALRNSSDQSAAHRNAQTALPDRHGPDLDHHFVAFSPIAASGNAAITDIENVHVVELDGTKVMPVDHGSIAAILQQAEEEDDDKNNNTVDDANDNNQHSFLRAVAHIIRTRYMQIEPDSIEFTMMALCKLK